MPLHKARAHRPDACPPPDPDSLLLACIGDVADERALVFGQGALDVTCALIRAGARAVTELCRNDRPEPGSADLVVVPALLSAETAPAVVGHARRALAAAGRIILRCPSDPSGSLAQSVSRVLRLHGFSAIRLRRTGAQTLLTAELPLFGLRGRV